MALLLYAYITGVCSPRVIERRCTEDVAFRWLTAGASPDYRAIAEFRERHLSVLGHLFVQALALCRAAGVVRLGRVALDRTRLRGNASEREAISDAKDRVLVEAVSALLTGAERTDQAEDAAFGKNRRVGRRPQHLRRRDTALATIFETTAALQAEIRPRVQERGTRRAHVRGDADDTGGAAGHITPKPRARRAVLGALLLALTVGGGWAVAMHTTLTLSVDGAPMTVSTMQSRVIDVVRENGYTVGDHDDLYPAARSAGSSVRHHRAATRPTAAGVGGWPAEQAGVDDGLDCRRGPQAASHARCSPRHRIWFQPGAVGRHGAAAGQRQEGAHR